MTIAVRTSGRARLNNLDFAVLALLAGIGRDDPALVPRVLVRS